MCTSDTVDRNILIVASELMKRSPVKILPALLADIIILETMLLYKGQPATVRYISITGNTSLGCQCLSYICCQFDCAFLILPVLLPHCYMKCLTNSRVTARKKVAVGSGPSCIGCSLLKCSNSEQTNPAGKEYVSSSPINWPGLLLWSCWQHT